MKRQIKGIIEQLASHLGPHTRNSGAPRLWVLMYHRILPKQDPRYALEEPGMIVTLESFRQQLRELKNLFEIVRLGEWSERRANGQSLPSRACAVTFDDGWLDNYEFAFPILQEEQVPATLFAVADMIGTQRQFWPNRLSRVLGAAGSEVDIPWLREFGWQAGRPVDREVTAQIILRCKQLGDNELHERLDAAEASLGLAPAATPALVDWDQLRRMQGSGVFDIGSHTCNHFRLLPSLPEPILIEEVAASRRRLEAQLERPVTTFCYPNGDYSPAAAALVRDNYRAAVTTQRGINDAQTPLHTLLRIGIHEDMSNTTTRFRARLSGWV